MKKKITSYLSGSALLLFVCPVWSQVSTSSELFLTLKANDSIIFDICFNTCKVEQFKDILSADFEFYHDQGGITPSFDDFVNSIKDGLCSGKNKTRRELEEASMEVFPLYNQGVLYGALQKGIHSFYNQTTNGNETLGSTAKFTHLWLLEKETWKLSRVLSYDHR